MKTLIDMKPGRDNNQRLHKTMRSYGISRRWVAENLCVHLTTVDRWLQPEKNGGVPNPTYRAMPDSAFKLFKYCLNDEDILVDGLYRNPPDGTDLPRRRAKRHTR